MAMRTRNFMDETALENEYFQYFKSKIELDLNQENNVRALTIPSRSSTNFLAFHWFGFTRELPSSS